MTELDLAVLTFLANALWQGALIALAAWCAVKALEGASAKGHYWIWCGALALSLLAPALSMRKSQDVRTIQLRVDSTEGTAPQSSTSVPAGANWAAGIYAALLLLELAKVARSWQKARLLLRRQHTEAPKEWLAILARMQRYFALSGVKVGISEATSVPLTAGYWKPVILLPAEFDGALVEATLAHELAHIARRDYAWNIVFQIFSIPLAILPGVSFIKRQIERAREMACDEMAAEALSDRRDYARQLVGAAELLVGRVPAQAGLGVLDGNVLEARVHRLVSGGERATRGAAVALALLVTVALSSAVASYTPLLRPSQALLSGTIADASGAVVPGARVDVRGAAGFSASIATNAVGAFRTAPLPPDEYTLEVRSRGFRILRSKPFRLQPGTELNLRGSLEIGRIRETINVIGN